MSEREEKRRDEIIGDKRQWRERKKRGRRQGEGRERREEEEALLLHTALADKRIRHVDLVRLCEAEGYKMSEATMRRHRAGGCRCD